MTERERRLRDRERQSEGGRERQDETKRENGQNREMSIPPVIS